jgi:ribose transport system substrate-binding protein
MKSFRICFKAVMAAILVLGMLIGCGPLLSAAFSAEKVVVGLILSDLTNEFFVTMNDGAKEKAAEYGYEIVTLDSGNDASVEMTNMEDMISRKPTVIAYNPVDSDAAATAIELANKAGIPVLTVDRSANGGEVICHIASDNVYGGKIAGQYILDRLGSGGGKLVEIQGQPGNSAANDRGQGFHEAVDNAPNVTVVLSQTGNWDKEEAMSIMENALTANPDIKAVFCHNDVMALGVMEACINQGRKDIVIVGFDADPTAVAAVKDGTMAATVQQLPALMGSLSVETAFKYVNKQPFEKNIGAEVSLITK